MKKIYIQSIILLIALLISSLSYTQKKVKDTPKTFKQEVYDVTKAHTKAEIAKKISTELTRAAMNKNNRAVVSKATSELMKSVKQMTKKQTADFLTRLSKMSSDNLSKLAELSPRGLNSFAASAVAKMNKSTKDLMKTIAKARNGTAALKAVSKIDNILANGGKISQKLIKNLKDAARNLPPGYRKTFLDYLKNKSIKDWKEITDLKTPGKGPGGVVGGVIDGVFVLYDAYDIYYSDDEPEIKAINATSKGIGYVAGAFGTGLAGYASNATVTAAGGFFPGLIIALTADRVATLYTEIAMLEREKADVKDREAYTRTNNRILMMRQFVNVSNKLKAGEIRNANHLLYKLKTFLLDHSSENEGMLFDLLKDLEEESENAERNLLINEAINAARLPYQKAANFYKKGVELHIAKIYAAEALTILNNNLKIYPEIGGLTAISKAKQLINAINEKIANAAEFSITRVAAPERVYVGQSIDIPVFVTGGIPYYSSVGETASNTSDDAEVTVFWYASVVPGIENFTITLKDCMGSTASTSVSIEVVEGIEEELEEPADVDYSDLKEFIKLNRDGIPVIIYSANKYHIGYSAEYVKKTKYENREENEGVWVSGSSGKGSSNIWYCLPHGPYRKYYIDDDGKILKETGFYNNGLKHGEWTYYNTTGNITGSNNQGTISEIVNYKNDVLHGTKTTYRPLKKNILWKTENYKDGKEHGTQIVYQSDVTGGILDKREYQDGKFISGYYYYYKISGKPTGVDADGNIIYTGGYWEKRNH